MKDDSYGYMKLLDPQVPYCEDKFELDVGKEFFVEIANELPGRDEYNELIREYRRGQWDSFDAKWSAFREGFPDSPLIEAGAFLYLQTRFDRIESDDGVKSKEIEKLLREAALAYPDSTLAPVVWSTAAAFFLKHGAVQKALPLYVSNERRYGDSPLGCVFRMGIGESNFLLRDWAPAIARFEQVAAKCGNARLKVAAQVRLADVKWLQSSPSAEALYEKVLAESDNLVERYFPSALYHLGENKYRKKAYDSAQFYFDRFFKIEGRENKCVPYALKRLADINFRTENAWQKAVGYYLAVREQYPYSDVGRFSYLHALLIGLPTLPQMEYERRLKVIDGEIDRIKDESLRDVAYVEKGLALLDAGEKSAIGYLVRLNERTQTRLNQGPAADFIRDRLIRILKAAIDKANLSDSGLEGLFQPVELAYGVWLKGSTFEKQAQKYYSELVLYHFAQHVKNNGLEAAFDQLDQWTRSKLWSPTATDWESRQRIGESLADLIFKFEGGGKSPSYFLLKKEKLLQTFLQPEFQLLWAQVAMDTGDKKRLQKIATALKNRRGLAYVDSRVSKELQSRMWLAAAESFGHINDYRAAEQAYTMVKDEALQERALSGRTELHVRRKDWKGAYLFGKQLLTGLKAEKRVSHLQKMQEVVLEGKLWEKATEVLAWAKEAGLVGRDLAPFHSLAGRAQYELKQYRSSIESLENALKDDPQASTSNEARFWLGKALGRERRLEQARVVFRELAEKKDPFWSPLANNEIKFLK